MLFGRVGDMGDHYLQNFSHILAHVNDQCQRQVDDQTACKARDIPVYDEHRQIPWYPLPDLKSDRLHFTAHQI